MSVITLLPLALTLILALACAYFALTRKSQAQSLCVREATKLQSELGDLLTQLLRLNPRASHLRLERQQADLKLEIALASGYPPSIALAQAEQTAVIAAQMALRAQQQALLVEAATTRVRHQRELGSRIQMVSGDSFASSSNVADLAVKPEPPLSLTPDYVPMSGFEQAQQHKFSFHVPFELPAAFQSARQETACVVSLKNEGTKWIPKILAASASSKPHWR